VVVEPTEGLRITSARTSQQGAVGTKVELAQRLVPLRQIADSRADPV
jgi:hypothetical protein